MKDFVPPPTRAPSLPDFSRARVLVVGDLMIDRYWHGGATRISPEAPVPVVRVERHEDRLGGAGNVAFNLAALGAKVHLIGYTGADQAAEILSGLLAAAGIGHDLLQQPGLATITKLRVISHHQQLIRLDFEDGFGQVPAAALLGGTADRLPQTDILVLSDYGKGTLAPVSTLIEMARAAGIPTLVDPKGRDFDKYRGATVLTPNLAEFEAVTGECRDESELVERGNTLREELQLDNLLITRGERGMTLLRPGAAPLHLPTHAREVYDVTGAGDTVISTLAAALAAGYSLVEATRLANVAAGLVVGKLGTASIDAEELGAALLGPRAYRHGVIDLADLLRQLESARSAGEKIVVTNGCFDILHPGHVHYLQEARKLGDRLIVLVNSNESVRRLKGPERPINDLSDRMAMLAALECVDWVIAFDGDTPREEICRIRPDVLVKGGDYRHITDIAGHDCVLDQGGEVKILPFVDGHSTTRLIEAIRGDRPPH